MKLYPIDRSCRPAVWTSAVLIPIGFVIGYPLLSVYGAFLTAVWFVDQVIPKPRRYLGVIAVALIVGIVQSIAGVVMIMKYDRYTDGVLLSQTGNFVICICFALIVEIKRRYNDEPWWFSPAGIVALIAMFSCAMTNTGSLALLFTAFCYTSTHQTLDILYTSQPVAKDESV